MKSGTTTILDDLLARLSNDEPYAAMGGPVHRIDFTPAEREALTSALRLAIPNQQLKMGLRTAIRAADLALFVVRKQGVMPNSSWESGFNSDLEAARASLTVAGAFKPRPIDEYHEDMGPVLWWHWIDGRWAGEAPYVGTPNDLGFTVQVNLDMHLCTYTDPVGAEKEVTLTHNVGGWPGYHTHFTPIETPEAP